MDGAAPSRTAVLVCQGRAAADGRLAVGRFSDPVARRLLRPAEGALVQAVREGIPPPSARARWAVEAVRACAEVVVPRTVAVDEAVAAATGTCRQVVIVGAGLDTRPWRLQALVGATVFTVDHPASQADATERAAALPPAGGRLVFVAADLRTDDLAAVLAAAGHDAAAPTVWIWEGVVPYLTRTAVAATVTGISGRSAPGSVLVVTYQTPSRRAALGRWAMNLVARLSHADVLAAAEEPWRSLWTPPQMAGLLGDAGLPVRRDADLLQVARQVGSPTRHRLSLRNGRVMVAGRDPSGQVRAGA